MLTGTFDSTTGVYCFNGNYMKPKYYANSLRNSNIAQIYSECINGYDNGTPKKWPKTILVTYEPKWNEIKKHYPGLYAQSQLHYYDADIPAGQVPAWAVSWEQSGFLLMHEFAPGKVAWLRDEASFESNDKYIFFDPCDAPDTGGDTGSTTGSITIPTEITVNLHVWHHEGG